MTSISGQLVFDMKLLSLSPDATMPIASLTKSKVLHLIFCMSFIYHRRENHDVTITVSVRLVHLLFTRFTHANSNTFVSVRKTNEQLNYALHHHVINKSHVHEYMNYELWTAFNTSKNRRSIFHSHTHNTLLTTRKQNSNQYIRTKDFIRKQRTSFHIVMLKLGLRAGEKP